MLRHTACSHGCLQRWRERGEEKEEDKLSSKKIKHLKKIFIKSSMICVSVCMNRDA